MRGKFVTSIAAVMFILGGCAPPARKPVLICPGKESVAESLGLLKVYAEDAKSIKANGKCLAKIYSEGKARPHKKNFTVKLWFSPPAEIRLLGNVAFNSRGIDVGANESEFWLAMKPKEIGNSYFWGRWSDGAGFGKMKIGPDILLDAFGMAEVDEKISWILSNEGAYDVLTGRNETDVIVKKIYIYNCDERIRKIEYFGGNGEVAVVLEMEEYVDICKGVQVPKIIKVVSFSGGDTEDSFKITLDSVRQQDFDEKLRKKLFTRPEPRGFERKYRIIKGEIIEQTL